MSEIAKKHSHYHKDVRHLAMVDVYRVLQLFNVTDPCLQHAIKKLLVAGGRGAGKDVSKDVQEAIDSLVRMQEMSKEDFNKGKEVLMPMPEMTEVYRPSDMVMFRIGELVKEKNMSPQGRILFFHKGFAIIDCHNVPYPVNWPVQRLEHVK